MDHCYLRRGVYNGINMEKEPKQEFVKFDEEKIAEIKTKLDAAFDKDEDIANIFQKTSNFARELQKKYPDFRNYRLYHLLILSSVGEGDCDKFDFPGDDSVEKFIDEL